ncbi:MAG: DUF4366 domain-containing protein [Oscillospiraceae bacterium]|nr:DUF4366 domain-containing protein [Oscillospiraceae bacterium]
MKPKFRLFACVMAAVLCMTAFSMTAFASGGDYYESNEGGNNTPPSSIDSITVSTEGVKLPENSGSEALTPDGNLSLIDDIQQLESYASDESELKDKQFITVQSKNGNYFYIVIDRSGDSENVYFMNLVDEADLMALMEDSDSGALVCTCSDRCTAGDVDTNCPICKNNMSECAGKEAAATTPEPDATIDPDIAPADSEKSGNNSGLLLIVLVLALAGGGAVYYFKFRKNKPQTKGTADLDDYDYGEDDDEEEYEIEDDPDDGGEGDAEK